MENEVDSERKDVIFRELAKGKFPHYQMLGKRESIELN
ncbi:MAG: hypothetical protein NT02SARS_1729 [SAR86 cluster bacterium SAR86B]|uniref:Uncharacterized protein n=1 Tax=SAR86 cluster bacterium SAR86B TaxID=1123867 RepID=J5KSI5_9GAMM|nr:MAG: hypothetical protein NT02SARS_1729 [SAR86 cluster bacterium SAR86B]